MSIGLLLGAILFVAGLATYVFAPRVGPNPIFGVRVGYSYANREVWDRSNRFGGMLLALTGLGLLALAVILSGLGIPVRAGVSILSGVMLVALLAEVVWMFAYARGLAQGTAISQELAPVRFRWAYVAPVLSSFLGLVAVAAVAYPMLPVDHVASHFNVAGQPDGWMPRGEFLLVFLGFALALVVFDVLIVLVATREPLIAFGRWGRWRLDPEEDLLYVGIGLGLVNVLYGFVFLDVIQFNARGSHLFPLSGILWMIGILIGLLVGLFFLLAKRDSSEVLR